MKTIDFLTERKNETLKIIEVVEKEFVVLHATAFNTKPSPEKWSVAQCIEHLNLTLEIYIPQMVKAVKNKAHFSGQKPNYAYSLVGKLAVNMMRPRAGKKIPYRMKTFRALSPKPSPGDQKRSIEQFLDFQQKTLDVIEGLQGMSLEKPKIITAAGPILKMKIGDALHFMVAHNQRHILQAQKALQIIR